MRKIYLLLLAISFAAVMNAQVNVTVDVPTNTTPNLAASYPSLSAAITAVNGITAMSGPIVLTCDAAGAETATSPGFTIQVGNVTSATNTITFDGVGTTLTAAAAPTVGQRFDAVVRIIGSDYITVRNFTIRENPANTTGGALAAQQMTEFGVALFAASTTDGAQNNTIQGNTITMSSATNYQNAIGIFSTSASSATNGTQAAASIAGTNSNNKFYSNTISGVAQGLYFISPAQTATVFESGNDIGGSSGATANTITYGVSNTAGDLGFTSYSGATAAGVYFRNVVGNSVRYNTITSVATLTLPSGGIFSANGTAPTGVTYTSNFSNNNITVTGTGAGALTGIDFGSGLSTGTIQCNNNTVVMTQNAVAAVSAAIIGIRSNFTAATGSSVGTNNVTVNHNFTATATGTNSSAITGITVPSGTTGTPTINVLGNTVTVNRATTVSATFTATMSGTVTGIQATTAATTMNIGAAGDGNGNTVTIREAIGGAGTTTYTSAVTYINASATHATVNVVNNTLNTTGSTIRSTGNLIGVNQDATVTVLVNVKGNILNVDRVATAGTAYFQFTSGTPSEVLDTVSNNSITFTGLSGTTAVTAINSGGGPSTPVVNNKNINNNTISITGTHTGTSIGINCAFTNTGFIKGNSVTINSASPTVTGISTSGTAMTVTGNSLNLNSSTTSPTAMQGATLSGSGAHAVNTNTFTTLNFSGIITGAPTVSGIAMSGGTLANVTNNTITNISVGAATSTASPVVDGLLISGGTGVNAFKNKIYGITTLATGVSTVVNGIRISGGGGTNANNIYNNLIGELTASAATNPDAIRGIGITSTTATSTHNIYYNSVHISGGGGTNFGSSGIFHTTSGTATTSTLNLRNNVIVNATTPNGTGLAVAFRRNNATLTNYASTSNNNLLYAGSPSATNLIFFDGTNSDQTIGAFKTRVSPRETASVSENPPFLSTAGASANFLHMNTAIATQAESGAATIVGFTDDYDGDVRNATTPDIGADEFTGIAADLAPPAISYTPLVADCLTGDKALNGVAITDFSGVPTAGPLQPRVYYRKNGGAWFSSQGTLASGTGTNGTWDFTIVAADMGGLVGGDQIQYYVIAQDVASPVNIGSNPAGVVATDVNTVTTAPASPNIVYVGQNLAGSYTVGAGGNFPNLTVAIAQYNATCGLTAPVIFELIDASYTTGETFPLQINSALGASSTNTLTIRPTLASTVISGGNGTSIFTFNGAQYVTIDGRIGSTGTTHSLTVTNTNNTAPAITFINDATGGGVKYTDVKSDNTSTTSGVILFSTTTGANGNDNITIDNCNVGPNAANPTNGILSFGSTGTAAQNNSNNTISNCNVFDFYNSTSTTNGGTGININTGSTDWTITANSCYQTASRTTFGAGATIIGINVSATTGGNFVVSDNYVGGSAPLCGGAAYNINAGTGTPIFRGILISAGVTPISTVQNNTVRNISITSASTSGSNSAFSILNGGLNITGNTVGSQSATGDITFSTTGTGAAFVGLLVGTGATGQGVINITNNNVGGITATGTGTVSLRGITFQSSGITGTTQYTVSGNTVGSTTTANSLQNSTNNSVAGIIGFASQTTSTNVISNNTVANLTSTNNLTANAMFGILAQGSTGGIYSTTGNTVRNMTTSTTATGVGSLASLFGIQAIAATTAGQTVSQNTVYALSNIDPTIAVGISGISYSGPATGTNVVSKNLVYDITVASTSATADVRGINFASGLANIQNNMVRIGNGIANGNIVTGIYEVAVTAGSGVYYNSVYIGGTGVGTQTGNSYAFRSDVITNARSFQNNIFMNARSNATTGGKHYAVRVAGTAANPAGLTLNYNDYFVNGTGAVFGFFNAADVATLAAWQTAVGQDANSLNVDPNYIAPTAATPDLHITSGSTVLESAATPIAGITDDYDSQTRPGAPSGSNSGISPDVGADEFDGLNPNLCVGTPAAGGTASASSATICAGSNVTFTLTGATSGPGIAYQWQTSPAGAGTWTNVSGAISTVASFPITGNTDVRCLVTCVPSGLSTPSSVVTVNGVNCSFDVVKSANAYTSIAGTGTSVTSWRNGNSTDDNMSNAQPIGFTFNYKGQAFTQFLVSTNGFLTFNVGTAATGGALSGPYSFVNSQLSTTAGSVNTLAPFYEDLVCAGNPGTLAGLNAAIKYQVDGTAPNRVLTVEWIGMETFNNAGPNLNYQVKLYETTGVVEYVYGTMEMFNGTANFSYSYTMGLNGPVISAVPTVAELQSQQVANVQNFAPVASNSLTKFMDCGVKYVFTPGNYSGAAGTPAITNDEAAGATLVSVNAGPCTSLCGTYYSTLGATASAGITVCGAVTPGTPDDDVWFQFVATTSSQTITVKSAGGYDAVVQLFSDAGITSLNCVNATGTGLTETIAATGLTPGNTYYVRVYHAGTGNGTTSDISICVNEVIPPPVNDDPCGAHPLTVSATCSPYVDNTSPSRTSFVSATTTISNGVVTPTCSGAGASVNDVWFSFTAPASGTANIDVTPVAGVNPAVQVYSATGTCPSTLALTSLGCVNGGGTGVTEQSVASSLTPGATYYIRVYQHPSGTGGTPVSNSQFSICVYAPLPSCPATFTPANASSACESATATTLSWTAGTNATGYDVYFDAGAGPATTLVSPNQAGLTYNAGVLAPGVYSWRIEPRNANGVTVCSNLTFTVNAAPTINITPAGPINICAPATQTLSLGTTNASSPTYQWKNNGVNISGETGTSYLATASGNYTLTVTDGVTGCSNTSNVVSVTINPLPTAVTITPASATICTGSPAQLLTASGGLVGGGSTSVSSATLNLLIPDTQVPATDTLANTLTVSGIPAGATLDSIIVTLNITHPFDGDLDIYLQAPNGQIMELSTDNGSTGDNYTNTRITTDAAAASVTTGSAPFTGTFRAEGYLNAGNLASLLNGGWVLKIFDDFSGDQGILVDWSIKIGHTSSAPFTWTPNGVGSGLFTDAGATTAYTGGPTSTVYALPASTTTYTATATSAAGCISSQTVIVTVLPANTLEWTGAINSDWNNAGNWTCNTIPGITSNVIIKTGVPNFPQVNVNAEIRSLSVQPGATVTVLTGFDLKINN